LRKEKKKEMPQLDRLAYVSQVIWLVIMFFILYLVILKTGLPRIYKVLRFRQDKLLVLNGKVERLEKEVYYLGKSSKNLVLKVVGTMKPLLDNTVKVLESSLEGQKLAERKYRSRIRGGLVLNEKDIVSDLVTCQLVDENKYVKKGSIEKKVLGN